MGFFLFFSSYLSVNDNIFFKLTFILQEKNQSPQDSTVNQPINVFWSRKKNNNKTSMNHCKIK